MPRNILTPCQYAQFCTSLVQL